MNRTITLPIRIFPIPQSFAMGHCEVADCEEWRKWCLVIHLPLKKKVFNLEICEKHRQELEEDESV